jgi:prepilin-type N-terminal cleavage/methylation domain-containing protein
MEKKFLKRGKGFTLIELIAVLVIMAIIALIVTPLVMNIIRKARISADKRSVDAYGRSIELAIAGYLLDTGKFPTEVSQLTIEYLGNKVECETTQINTDSSVYLAGCTVAGRNVENYTYGEDKTSPAPTYTAYQVGDTVTYNSINYYVIKDSSASEETVTLLKAEPLTYEEITTYSAGTGAQTSNQNGYGGMQYHSSSNVYSTSYVKTTVDAWKAAKAPAALDARLITIDELKDNLGYDVQQECTGSCYQVGRKSDNTPAWVYNSNYWYWTMSPNNDSASTVWYVYIDGSLDGSAVVYNYSGVVRPVITISKSLL